MSVPTKTELGQEELRKRTHRLSQRHRTILLLVDGRRPLAEVLSLAQQAGASTSHFEDLLRLGLVALPDYSERAAPLSAPSEDQGAVGEVREVAITVVEPPPASRPVVPEEAAPSVCMPPATAPLEVPSAPVQVAGEPSTAQPLSTQEGEPPGAIEPSVEMAGRSTCPPPPPGDDVSEQPPGPGDAQEAVSPAAPAAERVPSAEEEPSLILPSPHVEPASPPVADLPPMSAAPSAAPREEEPVVLRTAPPPAGDTRVVLVETMALPAAPVPLPGADMAPRASAGAAPSVPRQVARRALPEVQAAPVFSRKGQAPQLPSSSLPLLDLPDEINNPLAARSPPAAIEAMRDVPARLDLPTLASQTSALPRPIIEPEPRSPGTAESAELLQRVRELLLDTMGLDKPLFSARIFVRVRYAETAAELIDLVWDIQHRLVRGRHAHRELKSLQQARELLGLGNTLVSEETTRPQPLDD